MSLMQTLLIKVDALSMGVGRNGFIFERRTSQRELERKHREIFENKMDQIGNNNYPSDTIDDEETKVWWRRKLHSENLFWSDMQAVVKEMQTLISNFKDVLHYEMELSDQRREWYHYLMLASWIDGHLFVTRENLNELLDMCVTTGLTEDMNHVIFVGQLRVQDIKANEFHRKFIEMQMLLADLFKVCRHYLRGYYFGGAN